jgi:hypothetical protein
LISLLRQSQQTDGVFFLTSYPVRVDFGHVFGLLLNWQAKAFMGQRLSALTYLTMKTDRAKVHLDALNRELDFFAEEPYTVITKEDIENSRYIRRYELKLMDPILGMLLGEFLYSVRSGLDQMAWQMAIPAARANPKTAKLICFPIFGQVINNEDRRNLRKVMDFFPSEIAEEMDALQPYQRKSLFEDHPLWQLNTLCNIDKHCIIPVNSISVNAFMPRNPAARFAPLNDENAFEISVPLKDKHQLDFEPEPTFPIEFGEWNSDLRIPRERLTDIHGFIVHRVLPKFSRFAELRMESSPPIRIENVKAVYK